MEITANTAQTVAVNNDVLGRGLLVGAFRDNDWQNYLKV